MPHNLERKAVAATGDSSGAVAATVQILAVFLKPSRLARTAFLLCLFSGITPLAFPQDAESTTTSIDVGGAISITNNGISTIPSFTLGKPAVIFDTSMGTRKLRFEPQFRFALEGKPWTFIFWLRYKLLESRKFRFSVGAHPAISFKTAQLVTNDVTNDIILARRFLAGELSSGYSLTRHVGIGLYYLYSRGLEQTTTRNTHYVEFNLGVSFFPDSFILSVHPQIYYLRMDDKDGFYVTARFTLGKKNFPFSLSSIINKTIQTDITAGDNFLWNVVLTYTYRL